MKKFEHYVEGHHVEGSAMIGINCGDVYEYVLQESDAQEAFQILAKNIPL